MIKNKKLYVIYGVSNALMKAAKLVVPKTATMLMQNSRYFDKKTVVKNAGKVIIVDDFRAEEITAAYVEAYDEDIILDVELIEGEEIEIKTPNGSQRDITEVKGLGKKTAEMLAEVGITTLEDLAALNDDVEAKVTETGIENLADFITKAEALLNNE